MIVMACTGKPGRLKLFAEHARFSICLKAVTTFGTTCTGLFLLQRACMATDKPAFLARDLSASALKMCFSFCYLMVMSFARMKCRWISPRKGSYFKVC